MPRSAFARSVASQLSSALEANAKASEPVMEQLWTAVRPRMMSTVARAEGASLLRIAARNSVSSGALKPCACGKILCQGHARSISTSASAAHAQPAWATDERAPGLAERLAEVTKHFPTALSVDDFMSRVEVALAGYGFTGDNAIGGCLSYRADGWSRACTVATRGAPLVATAYDGSL